MVSQLFIYLACVPVLGILAQLLAWWTRLPSILLLLAFGILLGFVFDPDQLLEDLYQPTTPHGTESVDGTGSDAEASNPQSNVGAKILFPIVSLSVAIILFEGGLSLRFSELKESGGIVLRLVTLGAIVSWILTALAARFLLGLDWRVAILLGAILVVTGPTVVVPLLRHVRPNRRIGSILKWEGIVIDPVGAILAVLVFDQLFSPLFYGHAAGSSVAIFGLVKTLVIGLGFGWFFAFILTWAVKLYWIPDFLHGVSFLSVAIGTFALSNWLQHESGLLTVTAMGIFLANQKRVSIDHVVEFKENLGVFLISCLFIVLGSRLDPNVILDIGWPGLGFLVFMVLIARPISVWVATIGGKINNKERLFISFLAPRGIVSAAVTSVFALEILSFSSGNESMTALALDAEKLVPITFLIIVGTVAIYGLGAAPLAKRLGLSDMNPQGILFAGASVWIREIALELQKHGIAVTLVDTNYRNVASAKMDGIQAYCTSILSDHIHEESDLSGIGRLMAMTSNDEVNVLATKEYEHLFGRKNVYQLPPRKTAIGNRASLSGKLDARILFDANWDEDRYWSALREGYRVKSTALTEEFTMEHFLEMYDDDALVLMTIENKRTLNIATVRVPLEPKAGQILISLVKDSVPHPNNHAT